MSAAYHKSRVYPAPVDGSCPSPRLATINTSRVPEHFGIANPNPDSCTKQVVASHYQELHCLSQWFRLTAKNSSEIMMFREAPNLIEAAHGGISRAENPRG